MLGYFQSRGDYGPVETRTDRLHSSHGSEATIANRQCATQRNDRFRCASRLAVDGVIRAVVRLRHFAPRTALRSEGVVNGISVATFS
jgi:hypothetical protein